MKGSMKGLLAASLVSAALAAPCVMPALAADSTTVDLQILHTNDFHGSISQSSKVANRPVGGAATLAAYLFEREATNPNTLIVHSGDMFGASQPVSSLLQDEPTAELLNFMGFDLGTLGNHEFDESLSEMLRMQNGGSHKTTGYWVGSSFPLISANIVNAQTGDPVLPAYAIKVVEGIPVGFIGVTTIETPSIVMPSGVKDLKFIDAVEAINKYVPVLKSKGVEAIMVLAHEGGSFDAKAGKVVGPIAAIAEGIDDEVDVIFSGHSHTMLNNVIDGKLVVQAWSKGTAFSDVDLTLDKATGDVVSAKAEIVTTFADTIKPEPRIAKLAKTYEAAVKPLVERYIADAADDITRTQSAAGESALGNLVADAQRWAAGTQIAFMNPGGIRRDLPKGPLTWGILYETQPFANDLMRFEMTGDQIFRVLNQQWQVSGKDIITRFLQISGIKVVWDSNRPFGDKVVKVMLEDGGHIDKDAKYSVVANIFIATGGDNFSVFKETMKGQELVMNDLDALVKYLEAKGGAVSAKVEGRASLAK